MARRGVKDIDLGYRRIMRELAELGEMVVLVGVGEDAGAYDDGTPVAAVGAMLEYGTSRMPARPWLTIGTSKANVDDELAAIARAVTKGGDARRALDAAGERIAERVKSTLSDDVKPLAPSTVAQKGSSQPLIDTGRLKRSITARVVPARQARGEGA
jgi:hypothetical protein